MPQLKITADLLAAALMGFEVQKFAVEGKIAEIRVMLNEDNSEPAEPAAQAKPRKKRSAAIRKKMAVAQKKRWAAIKAASAPTATVAKQVDAPSPKTRKPAARKKAAKAAARASAQAR